MNSATPNVPWSLRALAFVYYVGGAPFLWFSQRRKSDPFLRQQYNQSAIVFLLFFVLLFTFALVISVLSYALVYQREVYETAHLERHLLTMTRRLGLCWLVFWTFSAALALLGSCREILLVTRLAQKPRLVAAGILMLAGLYTVIAAVTPVAIHASSLVRAGDTPGQVYLVYDDVKRFPRWIFALGFYRISLAAEARWGKDSVVALRLSPEAIRRARAEGRFLFLATHGKAQGLLCDGGWIQPADVSEMPANPDLEYVYLTSCDSGAQREAWEEAFAPAQVVTFDRLTAIVEHAWWLWFRGPEVIRELH